ncbi:MAG: ACT protein [uncultured bacterium]|nr:MAG: ACT protein [uncultured bacterium]HBH19226.1 ACT domain-containing protein [Cyanobacteria bacterium UBA9579]
MDDSKIIITIIGVDKVGIVATFANALAQYQVNIEDISQTIMQDHFTMIMMADFSKATSTFKEFKDALSDLGKETGMEVWVQRKKIFDNMHHVS